MNRKQTISAVIICKNEQDRIAGCIDGVSFADETIVIDNGSTDNTETLAKKHNVLFIREKTKDFSYIRNLAVRHAKGEWLLYVDADETVTEDLCREIEHTVMHPDHDAYVIPRENYYLGSLWPVRDGMVRLIKKSSLIGWVGIVHEHAEIKGTVGTLLHPFIHHTHRSLEEMVAKTNQWSETEALLRFRAQHPAIVWWRIIRVMLTQFFEYYFRQGGWKAGTVGLIESIYQSFSIFITYAKLWELQQKNRS